MTIFETEKKPLTFLLDQIENKELALPDFQRSFVWDASATRELVVSVIRGFPAGTLLLMKGGATVFAPRTFEEAPLLSGLPSYLVLDGQQRLTSLYQAFIGRGTHRYFVNLQELIDGLELDEAVEVYPLKRVKVWSKIQGQANYLALPLERVRDFADWRDEVVDLREKNGDDPKKLRAQLNELEKKIIKPVEQYQFPVTTLSEQTPVEAICTIFETLNRTGVKLSVFELITARAFAHEIRLRDMWRQALADHPILEDFAVDPYYLLQAIAVNVKGTPTRSVVLGLNVADIVHNWPAAVDGMAESLGLLRDECGVLVLKWLPYQTMLITMAAAWPVVVEEKGPNVGVRRAKLQRWFWCSVFSGSYENAANSATSQDVPALVEWLRGGNEPAVVQDFSFDPQRWRDTSYRQRALYRATIALTMRHAPRDFHEGASLNKAVIEGAAVDDHHVFPQKFLKDRGQQTGVDSVLNHTLMGKLTNIRIGGKAPSVYLEEMRGTLGDDLLAEILHGHRLPPDLGGPLVSDDFEGFLLWRTDRLMQELQVVTAGVKPEGETSGRESAGQVI